MAIFNSYVIVTNYQRVIETINQKTKSTWAATASSFLAHWSKVYASKVEEFAGIKPAQRMYYTYDTKMTSSPKYPAISSHLQGVLNVLNVVSLLSPSSSARLTYLRGRQLLSSWSLDGLDIWETTGGAWGTPNSQTAAEISLQMCHWNNEMKY